MAPDDVKIIQRVAELSKRLNEKEVSIAAYKRVIQIFAAQGFWAKAIAMGKIALNLDPTDTSIQQQLAKMYSAQAKEQKESANLPIVDAVAVGDRKLGNPVNHLKGVPLFSEMSSDEFLSVIQRMQVRKFPAQTLICEEGDLGRSMYVVSEGVLTVLKKNSKGKQVSVATLQGGDFFGEFGLLTNGTRNATVQATTDCELLEITSADFDVIAGYHPKIWTVLEEYLKKRMVHNILVQSAVFQHLTPQEIETLSKWMTVKKALMGELLMLQGSEGDEMYFVKSGTLRVTVETVGRDQILIDELYFGDYVGEVAMLTGNKRTATVRAKTDSELFVLKRADAAKVLRHNPTVLMSLRDEMAKRTKDTTEAKQSYIEAHSTLNLV